jgi:segregation and condensation protein B
MNETFNRLMAILFVSNSPANLLQLATALELSEGQVEQALEVLTSRLRSEGPLQIMRLANGYQLSTKAEYHDLIAEFLKPERQKLTRSLLEILAIVAYRQPITAQEIDAIRGVQSDYGIRGLVERRLILEIGRKQTVGRPILYGTSPQFLHSFNLNDLSCLPPMESGKSQETHLP